MLRHKIIDLADRKAPSFAVLKGHEDEDAEGKENPERVNLGPGPESPPNPLPPAGVVEERVSAAE